MKNKPVLCLLIILISACVPVETDTDNEEEKSKGKFFFSCQTHLLPVCEQFDTLEQARGAKEKHKIENPTHTPTAEAGICPF